VSRYLLLAALAACNWTTFDDLQSSTWVKSVAKPNTGSSSYALAITSASSDPMGGQLGVMSDNDVTFSLLAYSASGSVSLSGMPVHLGSVASNAITALPEQPIFVNNGAGTIAFAATGGAGIGVLFGPVAMPVQTSFAATPPNVDAATFAGANLAIASGATLYQLTPMNVMTKCIAMDTTSTAVPGIAALAADAMHAYVWTTTGVLYEYPVALGTVCVATRKVFTATGAMPQTGARIHVVAGTQFALLVDDSGVWIADLMGTNQAGPANLTASGIAASAFGTMGTSDSPFLALGFPDRMVDGTTSGQVELHAFTNGVLNGAPDEALQDAQPTANQLFGRDVAVMPLNGHGVLAVAARNEVFTYYKTLVYDDTPTK
jgi:hypothetical protein